MVVSCLKDERPDRCGQLSFRQFMGILAWNQMAKVTFYIDDQAWKRFREQAIARHGTLRKLNDEVEDLIRSEDMETVVASGANKAGIPWERVFTPSAIKKARPILRGTTAETMLREMRDQRHAGRLPRH